MIGRGTGRIINVSSVIGETGNIGQVNYAASKSGLFGLTNGSGISLGHPVGATGAILTVKALYELRRTGGRYALITMCIGGGQGIAAIFERI
jgi:acetyl-CoA acetyltransferase